MAISSGGSSDTKIFIVRKGHGGAYAVPSPQVIPYAPGSTLTFRNFTGCDAHVEFRDSVVEPSSFPVPASGEPKSVGVVGSAGYFEYRIRLACRDGGEQYVEGASQPGVIIDR